MITEIKNLKDEALLDLAKTKAQEERDLTLAMIDIIREIKTRRLHLSRGYSSLHEFCVKELKYSDGTAGRRIRALELVTALPQVSESIKAGTINMTTASQVQSFFKAQEKSDKPMTIESKLELVKDLENKSSREVEKALVTLSPEPVKLTEKIRPLSDKHSELKATVENEFVKKIERLMKLKSHSHSTMMKLFESLIDAELKKSDPMLQKPKETQKSEVKASAPKSTGKKETPTQPPTQIPTRYIKREFKREVWRRDHAQCTYVDPASKRRCEQTKYLQYEHITPFAQGGRSTQTNLKLLCANHNKLMAVQVYGRKHMEQFGVG